MAAGGIIAVIKAGLFIRGTVRYPVPYLFIDGGTAESGTIFILQTPQRHYGIPMKEYRDVFLQILKERI